MKVRYGRADEAAQNEELKKRSPRLYVHIYMYEYGLNLHIAPCVLHSSKHKSMYNYEHCKCVHICPSQRVPVLFVKLNSSIADKPIFLRLIEDLFPGVVSPPKRDVDFWKVVMAVTKAQKLQCEEQFILKCVQVREAIQVRS